MRYQVRCCTLPTAELPSQSLESCCEGQSKRHRHNIGAMVIESMLFPVEMQSYSMFLTELGRLGLIKSIETAMQTRRKEKLYWKVNRM